MKPTITKSALLIASLTFLHVSAQAAGDAPQPIDALQNTISTDTQDAIVANETKTATQSASAAAESQNSPQNPTETGAENSAASVSLIETGVEPEKKDYPELWTGMYGGLNLGGNFTDANLTSNQLGFINPAGICNVNSTLSSFFPGAQIGYLHRFDSDIVMGVEGDFTYNTQGREGVTCPCPSYLDAGDHFTITNRLQGSLRGRLGYALDNNLLPFVSVGVSFADMRLKYTNEGGDFYNKTTTQAGLRAGAGLEWGVSGNISVRAEYYYTAYNSLNMPIPSIYGLQDSNGSSHLNISTNTVKIALNYWF